MHWIAHIGGEYTHGPKRVNHAAAAVGDVIYTFGGYCTGDVLVYNSKGPIDVYVLNVYLLTWKEIPRPDPDSEQYSLAPFQRYGHTAVAYGKNIYIWGGRNDELACNRVFVFDTETWLWSVPQISGVIPCPRDGHSACVIGNHMYIFGGYEEEFERYSQDVFALNLDTMCWTYFVTQGPLPEPRDFHTSSVFGNRMYIFGGRSDPHDMDVDFYPNEIAYLDTETRTWHLPTVQGQIPIGRRSHSAFMHNEKIYIFGGYNDYTKDHFNHIFCFCPVNNVWSEIKTYGQPPCRRRRQVCIVIQDKLYLFGGTSPRHTHFVLRNERDYQDHALIDHNDLHVLDFRPSLKLLCMLSVIDNGFFTKDTSALPADLIEELRTLIKRLKRQLNRPKKTSV